MKRLIWIMLFGLLAILPASAQKVSNSVNVTVAAVPTPAITSVTPTGYDIGSSATLTVNGTGFTQASYVSWASTKLTTSFVSASQLTAPVTATQTATAGTFPITVTTPILTAHDVELDWVASQNCAQFNCNYRVYRRPAGATQWAKLVDGIAAVTVVDPQLQGPQTVEYTVTAYAPPCAVQSTPPNTTCESPFSNISQAVVPGN